MAARRRRRSSGAPEEPVPKTEVERILMKANQLTDESLESTRRMRQMCEESKDAGINILVALDDQGEKLDRIEEDMDKINKDMREAEKNLSGMEKCCGLLTCPWNKTKEFEEDPATWQANEDGKIVQGQPARIQDNRNSFQAPGTGGGPGVSVGGQVSYVAKILKDDREWEMEENIQAVHTMVGNLRNMAIDMNSEIGNQNDQLGRINMKAQSNETRISSANERAVKLTHK